MSLTRSAYTEYSPTSAVFRRACISGACASVLSCAALARMGSVDCRSAFAPVNAVSHWVWGEDALHAQRLSARNTVLGYLIHHAMSVFWAVFYEAVSDRTRVRSGLATVALGIGFAALACLVDLRFTPQRLTPGFERRLSPPSLAVVYAMFGLGLAVGSFLHSRAGRMECTVQSAARFERRPY